MLAWLAGGSGQLGLPFFMAECLEIQLLGHNAVMTVDGPE